jgi:uncharacterized protein with FMN-binding domain
MKRVLITLTATVIGLVALLSYKTHGHLTASGSGLPSAGLPVTSTSTTGSGSGATSTSAPPDPSATGGSPTASSTASTSSSSATYTGTAITTRYGVVQVQVTVAGSKITNVAFVQLTAFDGRSQRINSGAAPILLQETLSAQSAQIDSVSGASYTSAGYDESLQSALDQAGIR